LDYAKVLGAEYVATGHYARLRHEGARTLLLRGLDANKDQSYFLQAVSSVELEKCLFPVGELQKSEVRAIAAENELDTFDKKDSTGICFIGERRFKDFLQTYIPARSGVIETLDGEVIGQHQGLMYHTLGQRQGLGIGGVKHGLDAPWYVVAKDMDRNVLIVAQGNDHPAMLSDGMICEDIHWVSDKPSLPDRLQVKCRYRQADQACIVRIAEAADGGSNDDQLEVVFDQPQRAVTPGQWACFYDHDVCLGGGIIKETYRGAAARRDQ
jgi:tRNA-specific 2-thiouridylase